MNEDGRHAIVLRAQNRLQRLNAADTTNEASLLVTLGCVRFHVCFSWMRMRGGYGLALRGPVPSSSVYRSSRDHSQNQWTPPRMDGPSLDGGWEDSILGRWLATLGHRVLTRWLEAPIR